MNNNDGCLLQAAVPQRGESCREAPREFEAQRELRNEALHEQPRQDKIRDVEIRQLNHGYFVKIGCQQFAIETSEKLLFALADYMKDPQGTEKAWFDGKLLK